MLEIKEPLKSQSFHGGFFIYSVFIHFYLYVSVYIYITISLLGRLMKLNLDQAVKTQVASNWESSDHRHPKPKEAVNLKQTHKIDTQIAIENSLQNILEVEVVEGQIIMTVDDLTTKIEDLIGIIDLIMSIEVVRITIEIVVELKIFTINMMIGSEIEIADLEGTIKTIDLGKYDSLFV